MTIFPSSHKKSHSSQHKKRVSVADKPHMSVSPDKSPTRPLAGGTPTLRTATGGEEPLDQRHDEEEMEVDDEPVRHIPKFSSIHRLSSGPSYGWKRLASSSESSPPPISPAEASSSFELNQRRDSSPYKVRKSLPPPLQPSARISPMAGPSTLPEPASATASSRDDPLDSIPRPYPSASRALASTPNIAGPSKLSSPPISSPPDQMDFGDIDLGPDTVVDDLLPLANGGDDGRDRYSDDSLDRALYELFPPGQDDFGLYDEENVEMRSPNHRPSDLTAAEVEEAIVDATQGVDDVDINDASPSAEIDTPLVRQLGAKARKTKNRFAKMTRAEKIAFLEKDGQDDTPKDRTRIGRGNSSSVDQVEFTITNNWTIDDEQSFALTPAADDAMPIPSSPEPEHTSPRSSPMGLLSKTNTTTTTLNGIGIPGPEHPPDEYRDRNVVRYFKTDWIDKYNKAKPLFTTNPGLHRNMFQQFMAGSTGGSEPGAKEIRVVVEPNTNGNGNNGGGRAGGGGSSEEDSSVPEMEYQYGNHMMYHQDVPDPDTGMGCGCVGPCDPDDKGCRCLRRQELYFYDTKLTGFAYHE